jgi:hypothetical protein
LTATGTDGVIIDGALAGSADGWALDDAHTPGMFWFSYLTTGAAIWHEKVIQLGAWSQFLTNPGLQYNNIGGGRSTTDLIINGVQTRAWGWQIRSRARAWWVSLPNSAEQLLMKKCVEDAAAQRAGLYDVPDMMVGNPIRDAWNANHATWFAWVTAPRPNPLRYWDARGPYVVSNGAPSDSDGYYHAPWQRHFISLSLYHSVELGFENLRPLAEWSIQQTLLIANSSEPRHIAAYQFPATITSGGYFQGLQALYDQWAENADTAAYPPSLPVSPGPIPGSGTPGTSNVAMESSASIAVAAIAIANGAAGATEIGRAHV